MKVNVKRVGAILLGIALSGLSCISSGTILQAREPQTLDEHLLKASSLFSASPYGFLTGSDTARQSR